MLYFDPLYFVFLIPAMLLGLWAQWRLRATYSRARRVPSSMTGAAAARQVLDAAGLRDVGIEQVGGQLSDHYDPSARVLRLSPDVFHGNSMAAVGIACHEAGHALQHGQGYLPLTLRNMAVPVANFGAGFGWFIIFGGVILSMFAGRSESLAYLGELGYWIVWGGIALYGAVVLFQFVNLFVEFDASARAKQELVSHGIVHQQEMDDVNRVLRAAAWTYVAATLQAALTMLYLIIRFTGRRN